MLVIAGDAERLYTRTRVEAADHAAELTAIVDVDPYTVPPTR